MIGRFLITDVQADLVDSTTVRSLRAVGVTCKACGRSAVLTVNQGLEEINGGGVLTCPECGCRQAVSRKRFEDMLASQLRGQSREDL